MMNVELGQEVLHMRAHGVAADPELVGNFLVALTRRQQDEDLVFPRGQGGRHTVTTSAAESWMAASLEKVSSSRDEGLGAALERGDRGHAVLLCHPRRHRTAVVGLRSQEQDGQVSSVVPDHVESGRDEKIVRQHRYHGGDVPGAGIDRRGQPGLDQHGHDALSLDAMAGNHEKSAGHDPPPPEARKAARTAGAWLRI
jgi:hypothetical protein